MKISAWVSCAAWLRLAVFALLVLMFLNPLPASAQILESFEYGVPPAGWIKTNLLGGSGWYQLTNGVMPLPGWGNGTSSVPPTAGAGSYSAYCSWTTGGGASEGYHNDQWLISPQLNGLTATSKLSFWIKVDFTNFPDSLRVRISTNGPSPNAFTLFAYSNYWARGDHVGQFRPWSNCVVNLGSLGIPAGTPIWVAIQEYEWDNTWNGAAIQLDVITSDLTAAPQPRANPTSLTFIAYYDGSDPAPQTFSIRSIGSSGMGFSRTTTFGAGPTNWLTMGGPSSGTLAFQDSQTFTASVSVAGLDLGAHCATNIITIPGATNNPIRIPITLNVIRRPQTISFPNPGAQLTTNKVGLAGIASSGLPVTFSVYSGPGAIVGATNLSFTGTGTVRVIGWQLGNIYYDVAPCVTNSIAVTKPLATILFTNLSHVYDGSPHGATVTTIPAGLTVDTTYNGSPSLPVAIGSYAVTSTVNDTLYGGSAVTTFTITRMVQTINFPDPGPQWTTNRVGLAATANSGLPVSFSVASGPGSISGGTNLTFSGAGTVSVVASHPGDADWLPASATNAIEVSKVTASVTLNNLNQAYDGTPRVVTATTVPAGLTVGVTYNGSGTAPTAAGTYAVTGTVNDAIYAGANTGTLTVSKENQTITFPALQPRLTNAVVALGATASSGLPVTEFAVVSGPGVIDGTNLSFSGAGDVLVEARQSGDGNWNPAPAVTNLIKAFSVNPLSGPMAGGNAVLISNGWIGDGASITNVTLCGVPATILDQGTNWVSVRCAPGTPGVGDLLIQSASDIVVSNAYTYNPTGTIFSVTPPAVSYVGGYPVTIAGTNLCIPGGVTNVTLCGIPAVVQSQCGTQVVVLAGAAPGLLGPGDVRVFSVSHGETVQSGAFTYLVSEIVVLGTNGAVVASGEAADAEKGSAFGSLSWGSTDTRTFAVTNSGQVDLGISGVTTGGAGAAQFRIENMPASVAAGSVSNFQVIFAPDSLGAHDAVVVIANDSTNSAFTINLSGTGARRDQSVAFPPIADQLTTDRVGLAATADSGLPVSFAVVSGGGIAAISDGTNLAFSGAGVVSVVASQGGDTNWNAAADVTNTFTVTKAVAVVTLSGLNQSYNGAPRVVTATTEPAGLAVSISYDGSPAAPVAVGQYAVTGTVNDAIYAGGATDTLVVAKGNQTINFPEVGSRSVLSRVGLAASAGSGLPVSFAVVAGPGVLSGGTNLSFTGTGVVSVVASQAGDGNWNAAPDVTRLVVVRLSAPWNDYDGDGISDRAVYDPVAGDWYIWSDAKQQTLAWDLNWGYAGAMPVPGDYDGDGRSDLAVFDDAAGRWYVRALSGAVLVNGTNWGYAGTEAVPGDYDGDGRSDLAVFDGLTGDWYIRAADARVLAWKLNWGYAGVVPVPGDYDGDGISDLAVYDEASGRWYVRRIGGANPVLVSGKVLGGSGAFRAVAGDYDGDAVSDLAVCANQSGKWYIWSEWKKQTLASGLTWGFANAELVTGDYNGDAKSDLSVYDPATGNWYIRRLGTGNVVLVYGLGWGGAPLVPVGAAP